MFKIEGDGLLKKKEGREKKKFFFPSLPSLMKIIAIRSDLMNELV